MELVRLCFTPLTPPSGRTNKGSILNMDESKKSPLGDLGVKHQVNDEFWGLTP